MNTDQQKFQEPLGENHVFRLYVAGNTRKSSQAVLNLRNICEKYLHGRYQLDVVDIYQNPAATRADQIIATPTLVRSEPKPFRKFVGDLACEERILTGLGFNPSNS
jgi:circadian clock protein KaiB